MVNQNQPVNQSERRVGTLPSDLRSRISRCYIDDREFKDTESGRIVKYSRLVIEFVVDGDIVSYECSVKKTDKTLLKLADDFSRAPF